MKGVILFLFLAISVNIWAKGSRESKSPIVGKWKYTSQSSSNDLQNILNSATKQKCSAQYFIFEANHEFRHEFMDSSGQVIKLLKGKWKPDDNRVKISYNELKCSFIMDYFFVGKDLILGRNFNYVIFTMEDSDLKDIALK